MTPRFNRVLTAIVFAVLWMAGMVSRSSAINLNTITIAAIAGAIAGLLAYWVLDKFSGRFRG